MLVLLFLAAVVGVLYLDLYGFPPRLKHLVELQFRRAGYAVQFGTLHLDVLRGVVATDAVVADANAPKQILARMDQVQLQWNWRRMFRREMPIQALRVANATISVPTPPDEKGGEMFTAKEAYATFRFLDDRTTQIERLSGVYCGIRVQVSGRVRPRPEGMEEPDRERRAAPAQRSPFVFVTKTLRELNSLRIQQPPQLDVNFDLDLARPFDSRVRAQLVATDVGYRKLPVQNAQVDVTMREGAIDISECRLEIGGGDLTVTGRYDIAMGQFDLRLKSTLDPKFVAEALSDEWKRILQDVRVDENPTLEARYVLSPETGSVPRLMGTVHTGGVMVRGVPFRSIQFAFENQGPEIHVTDARIVTTEGQLTGHGQFHIESSDFSYELDSTLDPRRLVPLMTPVMRQVVEPSWFETPPHIVASVRGDFVDPDAFAYDATLTARRCSYRGVSLAGASAKLKLRRSRLEARDIVLERAEGELRGAVTADFHREQVQFDIQTTANPTEMAPLLGPKAAELMRAYRFGPRTTATARGLVDLEAPSETAWSAQVVNEGFSYWKFTADRAQATLTQTNNLLTIDGFDADFYDGKLLGRAVFSLASNAPTYQLDFTADRVDVHKLLTAVRGTEGAASGLLNGHCALQGQGSDLRALRGNGNLTITDGVLGELGLFGIFSRILNEIAPGLGSTKLTRATATFTVEDNWIKTDDLNIAAGAYTLSSHGKISLDCKLDFRVNGQLLRALPGVNILTWFLSHVFEYKIGGTCSVPTYRPTNLPKELMPHGTLGDKPPED
jgi:hypothetical protein